MGIGRGRAGAVIRRRAAATQGPHPPWPAPHGPSENQWVSPNAFYTRGKARPLGGSAVC